MIHRRLHYGLVEREEITNDLFHARETQRFSSPVAVQLDVALVDVNSAQIVRAIAQIARLVLHAAHERHGRVQEIHHVLRKYREKQRLPPKRTKHGHQREGHGAELAQIVTEDDYLFLQEHRGEERQHILQTQTATQRDDGPSLEVKRLLLRRYAKRVRQRRRAERRRRPDCRRP